MKTKTRLSLIAAVLFIAVAALAQSIGTLSLATGGTANVPVDGTNTYTVVCSEFDKFNLRFNIEGTGASSSTVRLLAYRGLDVNLFETTPYLSHYITMAGTTPRTEIVQVDAQGGAVIRILVVNTNTTVALTNFIAVVNYKAPKMAVFRTGR